MTNNSLKISIRHSKDRFNLKRELTKYHSKITATKTYNHHGQHNQALDIVRNEESTAASAAIAPLWERPNLFTGGYANAIPFLESNLRDNSAIPTQNPNPPNALLAMTVLICTLAYLAQPAIRISIANCLLFPAIQAVPFATPATETPFWSTGPGPPSNSITYLCPTTHGHPITTTTTCPYDTPKNLKTLPILCQPLHGSTHGNTDTSNAVLVSKNSTNVITPPPPHENNTVSTPQKSKVNANADFHPAETETQENPNKKMKGGHKCLSKLVT